MTTDPHDEHGEILRRALHAEADTVNPAGDGLEHIRARIADGHGRRLGRFGLAQFGLGFDRFTVNWARPVVAVAAAVAIAGLGVTAPQTINLIQSVGSNGPSGGGQGKTGGDRTDAGGDPEFPPPLSPGGGPSGVPSSVEASSASSSPGLSSCTILPSESPTVVVSPGAEPTTEPATTAACQGPTPSQTPTTAPTTPAPSTPDPGEPTEQSTPPVSGEPAAPSEQGPAGGTP